MAIKQKLARKAVKTTAKHTAHGTVSKLKRGPARAGALLGIGALLGLFVGWFAGRSGGAGDTGTAHAPVEAAIP
jgi:ferric-dicitrate binding protein FerR (iron transport regulator)